MANSQKSKVNSQQSKVNSQQSILISIDWFLPGTNAGGPVRSIANLVSQLKDINFYIITSDTDYCGEKPYQNIPSNQWVNHAANVQVYYFSKDQLNRKNMEQLINSVKYECIYINGIYSKFFSRIPLDIANQNNIKTIVSTRGMLSPHALNVKPVKKKIFLAAQNALSKYKQVHFHVTNEIEKEHVKNVISKYDKISAIPNLPRPQSADKSPMIKKESGKVKFISLGRIAEEKGTLVSLEALRNVKGHVLLHLYGSIYNERYWQKCESVISKLPENIKVNYCGALPSEKVMQTLQEYHFLLLPSKGENYGHAIVESFIANRPVAISKHTPWKDLKSKNMGYDVEESQLNNTLQEITDMPDEVFQNMTMSIYNNIENILDINTIKMQYHKLFN